jgi:uncharacterized protein (DUF1499 family)
MRLAEIIRSMPRANVVSETPDYIHAEFPTWIVGIFGCADDLEVYLDDRAKLAHFRSSSRIRYYDFGSNRSRVEEIRARFLSPVTFRGAGAAPVSSPSAYRLRS